MLPLEVTATAIHGNKTFGCKSVAIKCFFYKYGYDHYREQNPEDESLHPSPQRNFFFYWSQTSAKTGNPRYSEKLGPRAYGVYYHSLEPHPQPDYFYVSHYTAVSIDQFARTCIHEQQHYLDFRLMWPNGYPDPENPANKEFLDLWDQDRDLVKSDFERGWGFDPYNKNTDGDEHIDSEDRAYDIECVRWNKGSADSEDWSEEGAQWTTELVGSVTTTSKK